eukprot:CAMPEP_0179163880 /NCGR_PEP_ID=MMETSP0796-20121207/80382_1 /TAXON_ID=73915 /ORGANISM="Pyrodinium bahamense, Strain pbaha01" /LENGTH=364 /DNA_ID=CAMNT_0020866253 /DNA_START=54 /DNA_END=1144 /DNA_ORIENTATION=-
MAGAMPEAGNIASARALRFQQLLTRTDDDAEVAAVEPFVPAAARARAAAVTGLFAAGLAAAVLLCFVGAANEHRGRFSEAAVGMPAQVSPEVVHVAQQVTQATEVKPVDANATEEWWLKNKRPGEAWPSLFCWSHIEEYGSERDLLISQLKGKFGIFACNDFAVISRSAGPITLGQHPRNASKVVKTWPNPLPNDVKGNPAAGDATSSYKNAGTFNTAWLSLFKSKLLERHDWVAKVDPDAVFFPERLRWHLEKRTKPPLGPGPFYVLNCNIGGGHLYGSLEVFSNLAIKEMAERHFECEPMPMWQWGEDLYLEKCMEHLVGRKNAIVDYALVGDDRCTAAPCTDGWRAAFHPKPNVGEYWACV